MNTQVASFPSSPSRGDGLRILSGGRVLPLGSVGGRLEVLHGRVWLTRAGDRDDHVVGVGEAVAVPSSGRVLVESFDDDRAAVIAWHPASVADRVGAALHATVDRCWNIVEPRRRLEVGVVAATMALALGAAVFGPISDARTRALAAAPVLHNSAGPNARSGADVRTPAKGSRPDVGAEPRGPARSAAQEARRGAPGVA